ncbi:hypothetical protein FOL47_010843 [Perkinsus chesapeaki]|uniref:Peptidase A1 domain-containing protein n=1 Tax=Perkinsus chesapeaki TaxID=330153 RepID=A0A7J6L0Y0_PERCH|nr:hypothetical protein FOL47_010843 [Perkinsus chesapeaki]
MAAVISAFMNTRTYPSKSLGVACSYEDSQPQKDWSASRRRRYSALLLIAILCLTVHPTVEAQVLRLHALQKVDDLFGYRLSTLFKMPTGDIWAMIDTGSPSTYFLWKDWYEEELVPGACRKPGVGCYTCPTPCPPLNPFWITYHDGDRVRVFLYNGTVPLSSTNVRNLQFGLTCGQQPPPTVRQAESILGLGPRPATAGGIPILQQLVSRSPKVIGAKVFALYLKRKPWAIDHFGELLLGGGDRRMYKDDLRYVRFTSLIEYIVRLESIQTGEATWSLREYVDLIIDTGADTFYVGQRYYDTLIEGFKREAAKSGVTLTWNDRLRRWTANCTQREALPLVTYWLGTEKVPLNLTPRSYTRLSRGICYLNIAPTRGSVWYLPGQALVGNYFEFRPDEGRIGFGETVA